jgi:hypothetical protein
MPDRTKLQIGDRLRVLAVPTADLQQREREIFARSEDAGSTANAIERIIKERPLVEIARVDEYGSAWFDVELRDETGNVEYHSLAIMDDDSWEKL